MKLQTNSSLQRSFQSFVYILYNFLTYETQIGEQWNSTALLWIHVICQLWVNHIKLHRIIVELTAQQTYEQVNEYHHDHGVVIACLKFDIKLTNLYSVSIWMSKRMKERNFSGGCHVHTIKIISNEKNPSFNRINNFHMFISKSSSIVVGDHYLG